MRNLGYFNSIKVRLKLSKTDTVCYSAAVFQFHKGTIKTCKVSNGNGSETNFNSIKVRLKPPAEYAIRLSS